MKKSTMMIAIMMAVSFFTMGTVFAQCCGTTKSSGKTKGAAMQCPVMNKDMSEADMMEMMKNCPMMKGKSDKEIKDMISQCPMVKYMKSKDKKSLTKEEIEKMMSECPMMKGKSDDEKKKMMTQCPMGKCISMKMDTSEKSASAKSADDADLKPQTTCPVMKGNKINKSLYVDAKGKRIYVCCQGCLVKVKADPEKYIKELEAEGIKLEDAPKK